MVAMKPVAALRSTRNVHLRRNAPTSNDSGNRIIKGGRTASINDGGVVKSCHVLGRCNYLHFPSQLSCKKPHVAVARCSLGVLSQRLCGGAKLC